MKFPRRRRIGLAAIAASAGLVPLASAGSSAGAAATPTTTTPNPVPPPSDPLGKIPEQVDSLGATPTYSGIYGGLVETNQMTHLDVYLTSLDPAAESAFSALASAGDITFIQTSNSLAHLNAIHQSVINASDQLRSDGIKLVIWYPSIQNGVEELGVEDLTQSQASSLESQFGTTNVNVYNVPPDQLPVATNRTNDTSPFHAGANVSDGLGDGCSMGFAIKIGSNYALLTAAHCFPSGTQVFNYIDDNAGQSGSGTFMGTVTTRDLNNGGTDTEVIGTLSSYQIIDGVINNPTLENVTGAASNPIGDQVCNDGAYSGEVCALVIDHNNMCIGVDGRTACDMVHAYATNSWDIANQAGDSGGPVFRYINGDLKATGIVSSSTTADTVGCVFNATTCYSDIYYSDINNVLPEYSASLKTP